MNCIIVHGCPSKPNDDPKTRTYDKHWIPWLKKELEEKGIQTKVPLMPQPWEPDYKNYKDVFDKLDVSESTVLIGHSCGTVFLARWLGDTKIKIKKLILVAPWKWSNRKDSREEFYKYKIDETIKERVEEIIIFTSDDEEQIGKDAAKEFKEKLGGKLIEIKGMGHYTKKDMGAEEFPELLEVILSSKK